MIDKPIMLILLLIFTGFTCTGCVSNQLYNPTQDQYLQEVTAETDKTISTDLTIIEFDEFGMHWEPAQLEDTLKLIEARNESSSRGIMLITFTHGWTHDANPDRKIGDLTLFKDSLRELSKQLHAQGAPAPDHVVGVFLGWRGATTRAPLLKSLSFWNRKDAAQRVASYQMRETLYRLARTTKSREDSKVLLSGHSMGGMILARTIAPTLSTLLLASDDQGISIPSDLILLQNPALDGLETFQFIDYLKRTNAQAELRSTNDQTSTTTEPAPGPVIVSITSETDWVTRVAYPVGQIFDNIWKSFRDNLVTNSQNQTLSQKQLANNAQGHLDFLISHHADLDEQGNIVITPVPDAYNNTPFWIVRASTQISKDHSDINNPNYNRLIDHITKLNRLYDTNVQTWIVQDPINPDPVPDPVPDQQSLVE